MKDYQVSEEEKDFLITNCPININKKSFKKFYIYTIAKELKTKQEILFFKFKERFATIGELGNLILLSSGLDSDIIVAFVNESSIGINQAFDWLQRISDKRFILITENMTK